MSVLVIASIDTDDDNFTSLEPHRLINGDAVKLSAAVVPAGLINDTIYYVNIINSSVFTLHPTRSNARDGVNQLAISSTGSDVTFLIGDSKRLLEKYTQLVGHFGTEPVAAEFFDYSSELVFVEDVNTDYSNIYYTHGKLTDQVFMQGLTTSPTYIFTQDAPKAAPGPEQLKEYWFLT
jgi:hypothetical protein